jgi:hypothetical protein
MYRHMVAIVIGLAVGAAMAVSPGASRPAEALLPKCGILANFDCIYLALQGDGTGGVTFTSYTFPGGSAQPITLGTCSRQGNINGPSSACVVGIAYTTQSSVTITMQVMVSSGSCFSYQNGSCGAAVNESRTFALSNATPTISDVDFSFSLLNPETMTIHLQGTGTGTVKSSPQGINCPATCTVHFAKGTTVTLTETPTGNAVFAGWGQLCASNGLDSTSCNWSINSTLDISPTFNTPTPPPPTPSPTPAPTATRQPTPAPTPNPTLRPGATPTPRPTSGTVNPTPNAPTSAPASTPATTGPAASAPIASTAEPTAAPVQTTAAVISGAPSLAPLDTAAPDVGQTASSGLSQPLVAGGLIVLLVGIGGGALFFFRRSRGVAPGP